MNQIDLRRVDLNLLVTFDVLMAEGSVTRAAQRLGRTQSAVSHSLARLRDQLGDPIMVKVDGRMRASPFAERLIEEVRAILHNIQRVLTPPLPFDPKVSTRTFRIAISTVAPTLMSRLMARLRQDAPGAKLEWLAEGPQTPLAVADGQIDVAFLASSIALPDGLERLEVPPLEWATFVRKGHPAVASWNAAAWTRWPHLVVQIDNRVPSPVSEASDAKGRKRFIAARVPNFSTVAPMLARTDLLATLPAIVMEGSLEPFGLCALPPPLAVTAMPHRFVWSSRLANDPAVRWLRGILLQCFEQLQLSAQTATPARRRASASAPVKSG